MKKKDEQLIPDEDYEYEKRLADEERERREALERAELEAEEERKAYEKEQQKKRDRQLAADRLELMKLKTGVIEESETIHEVHEEARVLSPKEKIANFLYHYKLPIIFTVFIAAVIIFIVVDTLRRTNPDMTIMMIADNGLAFRKDELESFFEKYCDDLNGDGKVKVEVMILPINENSKDYQSQNSYNTKYMAEIQEGDIILIISDTNTDPYYTQTLANDIGTLFPDKEEYFDELGFKLDFSFLADELKYEEMPNDIHLGMRAPVKTLGDSKEDMQKNFDEALVLVERMVDDLTERAKETNDPGLPTEPTRRPDASAADTTSKDE
ncbi:MAG: hypothetical protein IJ746_07215 [Ruminococcus sp.]|nr:hypothetical protein [Ruminococcus sp.]